MRSALRRETSALGSECEKPIRRFFDEIPRCFAALTALHRARVGEQLRHGGAAARKAWHAKQRAFGKEQRAAQRKALAHLRAHPARTGAATGGALAPFGEEDRRMLVSEARQAALAQRMLEHGAALLAKVGSLLGSSASAKHCSRLEFYSLATTCFFLSSTDSLTLTPLLVLRRWAPPARSTICPWRGARRCSTPRRSSRR